MSSAYSLLTSHLLSDDDTGSQSSRRFLLHINKKGSVVSVKCGPERGVSFPYSGILEGGCECPLILIIPCALLYKVLIFLIKAAPNQIFLRT
jgi:hypothetical protein